ncbi:MAG: hypothetical protein JO252_09135, partial [Planctomycetaceae bacterium]|nr:hypothetical protein [Planctomycetaceae bacterium]
APDDRGKGPAAGERSPGLRPARGCDGELSDASRDEAIEAETLEITEVSASG